MTKPTSRVLALLEMLQSTPRVNASELARRLSVEPRTVRRYIAQLVDMGVPVDSERGRDGGYRLRAGYKLPPMMFTADEALALSVGLRAAAQLGLGDVTPAAASSQAKLERVMPKEVRRRLTAIDQVLAFDFARHDVAGAGRWLGTLTAAAHAQQTVRLLYRGSGEKPAAERDIDVYGVGYRAGAWYAVGHCHLRNDLRSFRLDRVLQASPLPRSFGRPPDFDVLAYLSDAIATLPRRHQVEVRLRAHAAEARHWIPPSLGSLRPEGEFTVLRAEADDLHWVARELARLPCAFEVLTPEGLRKALSEHLAQLARQLGTA